MATIEQLERALVAADKAGDVEAARALAQALKQARATSAPSAEATPNVAADVALSAGRGAVEGLAGLPGVPGSLIDLARGGWGWASDSIGNMFFGPESPEKSEARRQSIQAWTPQLPTATDTISVLDTATGGALKYEPQTVPGEYARTLGNFATPAGVFGAAGRAASGAERLIKAGKTALSPTMVLGPSAASEAAGQLVKGKPYEGYVRLAAGLTAGGAGAMVRRPSTSTQILARSLPDVLTPNDVVATEQLMRNAARTGVNLTWPEAIAQATKGRVSLADVQRWVEQTQGGKEIMQPFMAARPGEVQGAMSQQMDDLTAGAIMRPPVNAGINIQNVSKDTLNNLRQRINKVTENQYRQAGVALIDPTDFKLLSGDPLFAYAIKQVRAEPSYARFIAAYPDDSVAVFNQIKQFLDKGAQPVIGGSNTSAAGYAATARDVKGAATAASPQYQQALERQARLRNAVLLPAEEGPLGKMAATSDINAQGRALLPTTPASGGASTTAQTVRRIARNDPDAAFQLVRNHLETTFAEQAQAQVAGGNAFGGAKWASYIKGNPEQAANLEAAIKALPGGATRWAALKQFMDVLEATGRRAPANSATAFNQILTENMKRGSLPGELASVAAAPGKSLTVIREFYERYRVGAAARDLARIFTDPNAGPLFSRLAVSRGGPEALNTAAALISGVTANLQRIPFQPGEGRQVGLSR